ncbi:MAG: tRNA pseudouridine(55) synthase TruB [Arachnia sp.]
MTQAPGVLVVDKPSGITSHQVVGKARRLLGTRKVGHAGTLDPMATGVLILGVNRATRLLGRLALHDKRYLATIRLGESSTTDDAEGEVMPVADASGVSLDDIETAAAEFRGQICQVPSTYSAIKVGGRRAYALARSGTPPELTARPVTITRLDLHQAHPQGAVLDVTADIECSSGTYIRSIARDLGQRLGVGGHLISLRRTRVGGFTLEEAVELGEHAPALMSMTEAARRSFPCLTLDEAGAADVRHGRRLAQPVPAAPTAMIDPDGQLLALYEPSQDGSRPVAVLVG